MVEEPEEIPPPPPPRSARLPTRKPTVDQTEGASPAWERSSSPTTNIDFGETADLSLSWSEDSTSYPTEASSAPPLAPHAAPPPSQAPASVSGKPPAEVQLSSEDLIAVWGKVGVLIHEAAASLLEKSKKMLVGDGTYIGFVNATLSQIPNAQIVAPPSYGYLVYSQVAASVQKRISDIMPGDVVVLSDAKFKGHKGLQSYAQSAGVGEPLIGIVSEYDTKKSKVKVFQANQHVGQQTVESVSYRLEDLKNGSVKVCVLIAVCKSCSHFSRYSACWKRKAGTLNDRILFSFKLLRISTVRC
ncbi:hypothetical protein PLICRDRAFT_113960 [Plicaturopsis crispa FD-325 SS-3]|nr:hypothetical protein PLICRDRAFT_113960 [Plicaturopsis crispa FD-325 SS-3]